MGAATWQPEVPRDRSHSLLSAVLPRLPGGCWHQGPGRPIPVPARACAPYRLRSASTRDPFCIVATAHRRLCRATRARGFMVGHSARERGRGRAVSTQGSASVGPSSTSCPGAHSLGRMPSAAAPCLLSSSLLTVFLHKLQTYPKTWSMTLEGSPRPTLQQPLQSQGPPRCRAPSGPRGFTVPEAAATCQAGPPRPSLGAPHSQHPSHSSEFFL